MISSSNSRTRGAVVAVERLRIIAIAVVVAVAAAIASAGPASAQDTKQDTKQDAKPVKKMVFGARQFEKDEAGGAVLCTWAVYLTVQAQTAACKLSRKPTDDAIDQAITAIDEYILTHSSLQPTRASLDDFKRRTAAPLERAAKDGTLQKICAGRDLDKLRGTSPDQVRASTEALLAAPREPVMNPCT
jgi:hypothetical protein